MASAPHEHSAAAMRHNIALETASKAVERCIASGIDATSIPRLVALEEAVKAVERSAVHHVRAASRSCRVAGNDAVRKRQDAA